MPTISITIDELANTINHLKEEEKQVVLQKLHPKKIDPVAVTAGLWKNIF